MARFFSGARTPVTPWRQSMRRWHDDCLDQIAMLSDRQSFTVAAVMGAGKTMLILRWLHRLLENRRARLGVIVVPTDNLRLQFCRDAKGVGVHAYAVTTKPDSHYDTTKRVSCIRGLDGPLPDDAHAIVITYAQLAIEENVLALRALCNEAQVAWAFDEVHHGGDGIHEEDDALRWADGMRRAAEQGAFRLLTTATPNRTDGRPIPFLTYTDGRPVFDYAYDYERALADGYVRPIEFVPMNGTMEWYSTIEGNMTARLSDDIPRTQLSKRLNTAVDPDFEWVPRTLEAAHRCLESIRGQGKHHDAGGLAVVRNRTDAAKVAGMLRTLGARVVVVTYDDANASEKIDAFRDSQDHWIVAVRMVSEGVDIRRLRVIAYCTNITTELLFLQIMGRIIRIIAGLNPQIAYMFIPDEPRIMALVETYRQMVERAKAERERRDRQEQERQQNEIWYGRKATGEESGRIHNSEAVAQQFIDQARPYCYGNHEIETAVARALQAATAGAPVMQTQAAPVEAWDKAKHDFKDEANKAISALAGRRLRSGQYPDPGKAKQSVYADLYRRFGSWPNVQHDTHKLELALKWLREQMGTEAGHASN